MTERAPFDPLNRHSAMADIFRIRLTETFVTADQYPIYETMSADQKFSSFMVGSMTGLLTCMLAVTDRERREEVIKAFYDNLPEIVAFSIETYDASQEGLKR